MDVPTGSPGDKATTKPPPVGQMAKVVSFPSSEVKHRNPPTKPKSSRIIRRSLTGTSNEKAATKRGPRWVDGKVVPSVLTR